MDALLIGLYVVFVLGIGVAVRRRISDSDDFLLAGRSSRAWAAGWRSRRRTSGRRR